MEIFDYQTAVRALRRNLPGGEFSLSVPIQGCRGLCDWGLSCDELAGQLSCLIEDIGVTSFDHADVFGDYEAETRFGEALKRSSQNRHHLELVGKCGFRAVSPKRPDHRLDHTDTRKEYIIESVSGSLTRLGTDYLDLLLIHHPDPLMRVEEVAEAFEFLYRKGLVRAFGVSNFSPRKWRNLAAVSPRPLVCNQIECSLLHIQPLLDCSYDELLADGLLPLFWSPLAGGRLVDGKNGRASDILSLLAQIGDLMDLTPAGVALAWLTALPGDPLLLLGTGNCQHLVQAVCSMKRKLERQDWYALWEAALQRSAF